MKITSIIVIMQRQLGYTIKITNKILNIRNPLTRTETLLAQAIKSWLLLLLLSSPLSGVLTLWAINFFGRSGPTPLVVIKNDDKIFARKGKCYHLNSQHIVTTRDESRIVELYV
ncbi:MAG: hypothetical protein M3270_10200 [Thermoproteota archaeon]|nr:hypothetical protein [Thermoproteota archaeon]